MLEAVWNGFLTGLVISTFTGPIFFMLIDLGLKGEVKGALNLALGTFVSDITTVLLIFFVARNFNTNPTILNILYIIGGLVLIVIGLKNIASKHTKKEMHPVLTKKERARLFVKGFLVNSTNPNVFFFWFGVVMVMISKYGDNGTYVLIHMITALSMVLTTDALKGYLASLLKPYIKDKTLFYLEKVSGIIILFFGVKLIFFH